MKLLLADDEQHVREGIRTGINWLETGITQVETARNGLLGREIAMEYEPDIVLTDVRMPKMNGIDMAFAIRDRFPECSIIFMSGYSDKEYLKSAITLKAISYVEKPIDLEELSAALREAVQIQREKLERQKENQELAGRLERSMEAYRNELMIDLTKKNFSHWHREEEVYAAFPQMGEGSSYLVYLVEILGYSYDGGEEENLQKKISKETEDELRRQNVPACIGRKDENMLLIFVSLSEYSKNRLGDAGERVTEILKELLSRHCFYVLAAGTRVPDMLQIYESYNHAATVLLSAFYYQQNCCLVSQTEKRGVCIPGEKELEQFSSLLEHGDFETAADFVSELVQRISAKPDTFIYAVKNFFNRLLLTLVKRAKEKGIPQFEQEDEESVSDVIWKQRFLSQIEAEVVEKLQLYFESKVQAGQKQLISDKIKYYISCHYREPDLSLATIAQKLELTSPYLCSVFKKETDMTLTNYITEYRVEQAKKYLLEENRKIKEIAFLTGYSDCNYFIKVFKKQAGVTPAEYRKEVWHE